ncbi:MAG: methyltransferase domain-containing protein [Ruminococcaceae bacterium]|nr:methyltransferase domain-containing protein [Oscillospiraceae bacterium]
MNNFLCPICKKELTLVEKSFKCPLNHSFDKAKSGYVNLLPAGKMNSKTPGDSKEMVLSRDEFLKKGYYEPLRLALSQCAKDVTLPPDSLYFDAGCGTGYYTSGVIDALGTCDCLGVDISKFAADLSAKKEKRALFSVASVYNLPLKDESVDLITCVFSPMADEEYLRILKKGGALLYVVPAPRHLFELKELLYENPYENEESFIEYKGFTEEKRVGVTFPIHLENSEDLEHLFTMTPYFWRTPKGALEKIKEQSTFDTTADFYIIILRKK